MALKRFDVEVPDGQHLGYSRRTDGALRAHLFRDDTNELAGHAELFEVGEDELGPRRANDGYDRVAPSARAAELNPEIVALVDAIFEWLTLHAEDAAAKAGERLRNWWLGAAVPACKSTARTAWNKVTDRRRADPRADTSDTSDTSDTVALVAVESVPSSGKVAVVDPAERYVRSSHEAQARRIAALLEADPSLLEEFVNLFPGVDATNGRLAVSPEEDERPTLRLVAG